MEGKWACCFFFLFSVLPFIISVPYKEKRYHYIKDKLDEYSFKVPPFLIEPAPLWFHSSSSSPNIEPYAYLRPKLIIWDPVSQKTINHGFIECPKCGERSNNFLRPSQWKDGKNERNQPRLLFSQTGATYLVSRIYRCVQAHEVIAHDEAILKLFPYPERLPFVLAHNSGITKDLYRFIVLLSNFGLSIAEIERLINQHQVEFFEERRAMFEHDLQNLNNPLISESNPVQFFDALPDDMKAPSNDFICKCIVHDYRNKEIQYTENMARITADRWISCDHTFKVAANIGLLRKSDQKWEKQYDSMFCVLNEKGMVMAWQLTKGTAFDKVKELMKGVKNRFIKQQKKIDLCVIDNCCAWKGKIQEVFGYELQVKLDLFHAIQRTVKCIPKRHPFSYRCCQAFRLVFRDPVDAGQIRNLPTPSPEIIEGNIKAFLETWKGVSYDNQPVLSSKALKEIDNLMIHVKKGCVSYIPVGCGSERNENLHKSLRKSVYKGRIGVALALALLSSFLNRWNTRKMINNKGEHETSTSSPTNSGKNELSNLNYPSEEKFGIGVSNIPENNRSLQLPATYKVCFQSLKEMQDTMEKAFDDSENPMKDCSIDVTKEDDISNDIENIENESFSRALNLYFLNKDLPQVVNHAVNTEHYHLMASNALFSFLNEKKATNIADSLDTVLHKYKFARISMPPDGDCLFSSLIFQLKQILSSGNPELHSHLITIGSDKIIKEDEKTAIKALRSLMVSEMLDNRGQYEGYLTNDGIEYEEGVTIFKDLGEYSGDIGNIMVLSLSNVLRMNMIIITAMNNFPIIPIIPRQDICTHQPIYLAFNHLGSGHYDAVVEVPEENAADTEHNDKRYVSNQPVAAECISETEQSKGCGCGRGAANKKKNLDNPSNNGARNFCLQVPGERRTLCPCYRAQKPCTNSCRCFNCSNPLGENHSGSRSNQAPRKLTAVGRKRSRHVLQETSTNSLSFMLNSGEIPQTPKWTKLDHFLVEVISDMLTERLGEVAPSTVCKIFNNIVTKVEESSNKESIPIARKSQAAIKKKLEKIHQSAQLLQQFQNLA